MESQWHAHPDGGIEKLLRSGNVPDIEMALLHPRVKNDPYACLRAVDRLHRLKPDNPETQHLWQQLMLMSNRPKPVWECLQQALLPSTQDDHNLLLAAQVAQVLGHREKAQSLYLRQIQQHPDDVDTWQKYVESGNFHAPRSALIAQLEDMLAHAQSPYSLEKLQFALSACLIPTDLDRAFSFAVEAQAQKKQRIPPWQASELEVRLRNDLLIAKSSVNAAAAAAPEMIFIVGMPRSGTTLLSSILGAHSAMSNVGEQNLVPSMARQLTAQPGTPPGSAFSNFAQKWYHAATGDLCLDGRISVDKLPANIENCGFILASFPAATVIHIRRDAHDCAASIHLRDFDFGCAYSTSAEEIAHYDALTLAHVRQISMTQPERMISVNFEELVAKPEQTLSHLLKRMSLSWEPQMLDFWKGRQSTATFSEAQVRRPLNTDGVGISQRAGKAMTAFLSRYDRASAALHHGRPQ